MVKFKTKFWKEQNINKWKQKYESLAWRFGFIYLMYFAYFLFINNKVMMGITALPLGLCMIISISYFRYKKKEGENGREREIKRTKESTNKNKKIVHNIQESIQDDNENKANATSSSIPTKEEHENGVS